MDERLTRNDIVRVSLEEPTESGWHELACRYGICICAHKNSGCKSFYVQRCKHAREGRRIASAYHCGAYRTPFQDGIARLKIAHAHLGNATIAIMFGHAVQHFFGRRGQLAIFHAKLGDRFRVHVETRPIYHVETIPLASATNSLDFAVASSRTEVRILALYR